MENAFGKALHDHRISVSELSRKTGVSRTTITEIIKGRKKNLTFETAVKLSDGIGCSVIELFPDIDKKTLPADL